jgi:hypothetical protein
VIDDIPVHPLQRPVHGVFLIQDFVKSCAIPIKVARILFTFLEAAAIRARKTSSEPHSFAANSIASVLYLNIEHNGRRGRDFAGRESRLSTAIHFGGTRGAGCECF